MTDPVQALIFDVDGTLAETEEAHRQAFNDAFVRWGLDWHWDTALYQDLLRTTGGKERIQAFQKAYLQAGRLTDADIRELHAWKTTRYGEIVAGGGLALRPGIEALMAKGRARGWKLAVATTTSLENVEALCRAVWNCGAAEKFDAVAAGDQVKAKKPAPDVFLLALERLGLSPDACIAFEDSQAGLHSARSAGLRVNVSPSRYTSGHDFSGADAVAGSFVDFADRL